MPTIEVLNGDLDGALRKFKRRNEGKIDEYKTRHAFISPAERRRQEENLAELKRRSRERRKQLRQEQAKYKGKDD